MRACSRTAATSCLVLPAAASLRAHPVEGGTTPANVWHAWTLEPGVVLSLVITAALYAAGVARLKRAPGGGTAVSGREIAAFAAGWLVTAAALVSPIDAAGGALF